MKKDTIAAISTAPGESGIGIVRLSGDKALKIAKGLVRLRSGKEISEIPSNTIHFAHIVDPSTDKVIDEAMVSFMKAPKTYTREDIVEINCHGGLAAVRSALEAVIKLGARPAEPGEFTKRAFLNGRIDLAQAEAVIDIITARTQESLAAAVDQLKGRLSLEIKSISEALQKELAQIEANIEFPEEEIEATDMKQAALRITKILTRLKKLIESSGTGKLIREGVKTTIAGKPNTGKSSLLNELLEEERAIVTHIPGTTRDIIEESIHIEGIPFVLSDTAGIREADDEIEKKGIEKTLISAREADIVLLLLDGSQKMTKEDAAAAKAASGKKALIVVNKCDLGLKIDEKEAKKLIEGAKVVMISAKTAEGIDKLKKELRLLVEQKGVKGREEIIITNIRHKVLLEKAAASLENALAAMKKGLTEEFISADLREALDRVGEITGRVSSDDILNRIFSEFCIGK